VSLPLKKKYMKIGIGGDHAGFAYKEEIKKMLQEMGHTIVDHGPFDETSVDYPDFAHPLANGVENHTEDLGILICGSGNGVAITANKHQGIRAALCWTVELGQLARQHNNANVLCLPARFISIELAKEIVSAFIQTPFEGGRHENRVNKIACT
jgi:ribose 5-phosphate isomerase B